MERSTLIQSQSQSVINRLSNCGVVSALQNSSNFKGLKSDLLIVVNGPFSSSADANAELKAGEKCGVKGYTKSAVQITSSLSAATHSVQQEKKNNLPFIGKWDCQVAVFEFTDKGYNNGSEWLNYKDIRRQKNGFLILFDNGYRIGLSDMKLNSMYWSSAESGDDFKCSRIRENQTPIESSGKTTSASSAIEAPTPMSPTNVRSNQPDGIDDKSDAYILGFCLTLKRGIRLFRNSTYELPYNFSQRINRNSGLLNDNLSNADLCMDRFKRDSNSDTLIACLNRVPVPHRNYVWGNMTATIKWVEVFEKSSKPELAVNAVCRE